MTPKPDLVHPLAVAETPTSVNKTGSWRFERPVFRSRIGPCQEACPLGEDLNTVLALGARGDYAAAYRRISLENPFPGLSGRLCHHPCERACNRGRFDQPVSVRDLERFVAHRAWEEGTKPEKVDPALRQTVPGQTAAVVGPGPAALAAAAFLARLGREVTLFSRGADLAGPARPLLEREGLKGVWDREAQEVLVLGVRVDKGRPRATDLTSLGRDFGLVFVAPGGWGGEEVDPGPRGLVRSRELGRLLKTPGLAAPSRAAVIGGGSGGGGYGERARAAAQTLAGLGAQVAVLSPGPGPVEGNRVQGVEYLDFTEVMTLVGTGRGLTGLRCRRGEGAPFLVEADLAVLALGERLDPVFEPAWSPPEDGFLWVDGHPAGPAEDAPLAGRWLMGRLALGKGAALGLDLAASSRPVHEIGRAMVGRRGALSLEAHLGLQPDRLWGEAVPFEELNVELSVELDSAAFKPSPRSRPAGEGGLLTPGQARRSARRCFGCGLCTYCGRCDDFCPDLSITIDPASQTREIDYDHCKGCGICAQECPRGAIGWVKEEP